MTSRTPIVHPGSGHRLVLLAQIQIMQQSVQIVNPVGGEILHEHPRLGILPHGQGGLLPLTTGASGARFAIGRREQIAHLLVVNLQKGHTDGVGVLRIGGDGRKDVAGGHVGDAIDAVAAGIVLGRGAVALHGEGLTARGLAIGKD